MVGSGETQLEADRRPIRDKIRYLKQQLRGVRRHRGRGTYRRCGAAVLGGSPSRDGDRRLTGAHFGGSLCQG